MKFFMIAFAALMVSLSARAEDPAPPPAQAAEQPATEQEAAPPQTTPGRTHVSDEMAKAYYDSCMGMRDQRMSSSAQDSLCECTSKKMQEAMSVENIRTMGQNDQDGRNMLNKMLLDVYAPCMNDPLTELVHDSCMAEDRMSAPNMYKSDLCACIGEKTAEWFTGNGRDLMAAILDKTPNITDPFSPIMESATFKGTMMDNMVSCIPDKKRKK